MPPAIKLAMLSKNYDYNIVDVIPYIEIPEPTLALFDINLLERRKKTLLGLVNIDSPML